MVITKRLLLIPFFSFVLCVLTGACLAQSVKISNDAAVKKIVFGNEKITVTLDYKKKATISMLGVNGQKVIDGSAGIYSQIRTQTSTYSSLHLFADPSIKVTNNIIS